MRHIYEKISGWAAFKELYAEMVAAAPADRQSHFVEIGCWLGKSAAFMAVEIANSGKKIKFDCVDPWSDGGPDLRHAVAKMDVPIFEQFKRNTAPVAKYIGINRMPSLEAAPLFKNGSLDFVMIDGDHTYEAVAADIDAWRPKVRPGGVLSGDDYNWSGVYKAVQERFGGPEFVINAREKVRPANAPPRKNPRYWWVRL